MDKPSPLNKKIDKIKQMRLANQVGFLMPSTIISNNPNDINTFVKKHAYQSGIIVKTMNSHYVEDNGRLYNIFGKILNNDNVNINELTSVPTIIQKLIKFSREARVTVIGDSVFTSLLEEKETDGE